MLINRQYVLQSPQHLMKLAITAATRSAGSWPCFCLSQGHVCSAKFVQHNRALHQVESSQPAKVPSMQNPFKGPLQQGQVADLVLVWGGALEGEDVGDGNTQNCHCDGPNGSEKTQTPAAQFTVFSYFFKLSLQTSLMQSGAISIAKLTVSSGALVVAELVHWVSALVAAEFTDSVDCWLLLSGQSSLIQSSIIPQKDMLTSNCEYETHSHLGNTVWYSKKHAEASCIAVNCKITETVLCLMREEKQVAGEKRCL